MSRLEHKNQPIVRHYRAIIRVLPPKTAVRKRWGLPCPPFHSRAPVRHLPELIKAVIVGSGETEGVFIKIPRHPRPRTTKLTKTTSLQFRNYKTPAA